MSTATLETIPRMTISVAETAKTLGVSTKTVGDMLRNGELPAVRVGKRYLVPVRELQAWVSERASIPKTVKA